MNFSLKNVSTSKFEQCLSNFIDIDITFIQPIICFYGMIANILNIFVFFDKSFENVTYKYLFANAISNFFYLLNCFFLFVARCGVYCNFTNTLLSQIYLYIFYNYLKGIAAILTILIQIIVCFQRLTILFRFNLFNFSNFKLSIFILVLFSTIFYSPMILTKKIKENHSLSGLITYSVISNDFGIRKLGKILIIIVSVFRGFISLAILLVLNMLLVYKFRMHMKKKIFLKRGSTNLRIALTVNSRQSSDQVSFNSDAKSTDQASESVKASKNITLMIAFNGCLFFIGNVPNSLVYIVQQFVDNNAVFYRLFSASANTFLFLAQGSDIIGYYFFNNSYRKIFLKLKLVSFFMKFKTTKNV